jgi:hypothetical protein
MRFLREMIVRKSAAGTPETASDEAPVTDFFELPPMRDRLARSRSAEPESAMSDMEADDPCDTDQGAGVVAQRLSAARHVPVERPRGDRPQGDRPQGARSGMAADGFDDLEFGALDPDDLDMPVSTPPVSTQAVRAPGVGGAPEAGHAPRTPQVATADDLDDAGLSSDDLTDDPALAGSPGGMRPATPLARDEAPMARAAGRPVDRPAEPPSLGGDDSVVLANIAAALPPAVRATLPAAPVAAARPAPPAAPAQAAPPAAPAQAAPQPAAMQAVVQPPMPAAVQTPLQRPAQVPVQEAYPAAPAPDLAPDPAPVPRARRIWDLEPEAQEAAVMRFAETAAPPPPVAPSAAPVQASAQPPLQPPAPPMAADLSDPRPAAVPHRGGRVRTRLLGFTATEDIAPDPMAGRAVPQAAGPALFPVGWIVVTDGPGRGAAFTLGAGVSSIGRNEDQVIQLDFGDTAISRQMHAAIAYDPETRGFFLGQGGKSNIVRLNGRPVLSTEDLKDGDVIRIGETTLKLVTFCGPQFDWSDAPPDGPHGARGDAGR